MLYINRNMLPEYYFPAKTMKHFKINSFSFSYDFRYNNWTERCFSSNYDINLHVYIVYNMTLWKLRTCYYKLKSLRWHISTKGPFYQMMQTRWLQVTYNLFLYSRTAINSILSLTADHCCGCMICITLLATAYPSGAPEFTPGF